MNFDNLLNRLRKIEEAEGKKPDFLDVDKDGDKTEPMSKAASEKDRERGQDIDDEMKKGRNPFKEKGYREESIEEAMIVQADGSEAMALLGILKLAGMPAPAPAPVAPAVEERDPVHANTPDERVEPMSAAVPSGNDLHREKGAYKAAAGADNAMAVESIAGKLAKMYEAMSKE